MVLGISKSNTTQPDVALSGAANTDAAGATPVQNDSTLDSATASSQVTGLHDPSATTQQPVQYQGDPQNQIIVFDMDETTLDTGDKQALNEKAIAKLGRKIETIAKDDPNNKFAEEIRYVLRPGVKELFEYLTNKGHKIILTTRNYREYADAIVSHEQVFKNCVSGVLARPDFEDSHINKDFSKYPNHPDNLGYWDRFKSLLHKIFVLYPKYYFKRFKALFTHKDVRWDPGRGQLGKYPPNMLDMLAVNGNTSLQGLEAPRILIDNQADYKVGSNPYDIATFNYYGREFKDARSSGDFAVISPNVVRHKGEQPTWFFADSEEPTDTNGQYVWVKHIIDRINAGWRAQYKLTTGKEPKV